ncbi:hypothetical protein phiOC_p316 [Ochrobactrum phage vB_OspM_OC]|nr:hypothetical protein phiOC_p316 [Ochrobactrum phage vB_OspM_OC]
MATVEERTISHIVNEFQEFCNSTQGCGYIKSWKAHYMINTCCDFPDILLNKERSLKYIRDCLEMEGFRHESFEPIWLKLKASVKEYRSVVSG